MDSNSKINKSIALVGSNGIHTMRYLVAIAHKFPQIIYITHGKPAVNLPDNVISYDIDFRLRSIKSRNKIAVILVKHHISIVHIQQANSYAYHTLKAIKKASITCKTILTTWGSDVLVLPHKNLLFKRMVRFSLAHVDTITSDSLFMSSQIRELAPRANNIHTINFGMQHFPNKLDLTQKQNIILSNRLHKPLYNIDKIITGFSKLIANPKYSDYKLVIAGDGSDTNKFKHLVHKLGLTTQVEFIGMVSYTELINWYRIAKLFISIPSSDATSLSLLEALGYGCYPILSNLPANLEWVIDQINGSVCQNIASLNHDMTIAIDTINGVDKYKKIAQFNYELIKQKAVFENNLEKFISLY
jgi:L-malate glycosyltransferase